MIRVDRNIRGLSDGQTVCQHSEYAAELLTFSLAIGTGELASFLESDI